jgi:hypothetical protein
VRTVLPTIAILALLASPALAQQQPPPPDQPPAQVQPAPTEPQAAQPAQPATEALKQDPNVARSQDPMPAPEGTRAPKAGMTDTKHVTLSQALERVWSSPFDVQGNPIQRPNELAAALPPVKDPDAGMMAASPKP